MTTKHMLMAMVAPIALIAVPADAATFAFDLTGSTNAAFTIDSALLVPPAFADADTFIVDDIAGVFNGSAGVSESITFNTASFDGGMTIQLGSAFLNFFGTQLFAGTTTAPTFLAGTYSLFEDGDLNLPATLTISEIASPVPEPGSWAMMLAGFGVVAYAMRRRARVRFQAA